MYQVGGVAVLFSCSFSQKVESSVAGREVVVELLYFVWDLNIESENQTLLFSDAPSEHCHVPALCRLVQEHPFLYFST